MFSDQVLAHPTVKEKFNEALDIMNRAVTSTVGKRFFILSYLGLFQKVGDVCT